MNNVFLNTFCLQFLYILFLTACEKQDNQLIKSDTNLHFIRANESTVDDTLDIKVFFSDILLVDDIFIYDGSSTDYRFFDQTVPKGEYQISVKSDITDKQRQEPYEFFEDDYWFLIFYWNPRGKASPDNEFQFTIHNDTIKVG